MRLALVAMAMAVVMAIGCDRAPPETPGRPYNAPGVSFSLTPSAARDCDPDTLYAGRLEWRIDASGRAPRLEIRVDAADGALLARSNEAAGSVETGPWVRRGMWFLLLDRRSGALLAAQRAGPESCD